MLPPRAAGLSLPLRGKFFLHRPTAGRPWARYELTVCVSGACRLLAPPCTASADPDASTQCAIPGCDASLTYGVTAVAVRADGKHSNVSYSHSFTTPQHG